MSEKVKPGICAHPSCWRRLMVHGAAAVCDDCIHNPATLDPIGDGSIVPEADE